MVRATIRMVALTGVVLIAATGTARAGGCEVLAGDVRARGECVARERAREQARAEVHRRTADAEPDARGAGTSRAWERAREQADGVHLDELVDARALAAVGGLAWFWLAVRRRRARSRRASA
jgi:hypothetical protein